MSEIKDIREQRFMQMYIQHGDLRRAIDEAGYVYKTDVSKDKKGRELIAKYQDELQIALRHQGVDYSSMAKVLKEGMEAMVVRFRKEGGKIVTYEVPDHRIRLDAVKVAADLLGVSSKTKKAVQSGQKIQILIQNFDQDSIPLMLPSQNDSKKGTDKDKVGQTVEAEILD